MLTKEKIDDIRQRCNQATPGPWMWDISTANKRCLLETAHSGRYFVMGFERWGTQGACPKFQKFRKYEGPVDERESMGMVRADKLAKSYPGKEHHEGFDDYIDHPDALFIAHARQDVEVLLAEIDRLNDDLKKQREAMAIFLANNGIRLFANDTTEDFIKALGGR